MGKKCFNILYAFFDSHLCFSNGGAGSLSALDFRRGYVLRFPVSEWKRIGDGGDRERNEERDKKRITNDEFKNKM